jgi:hypothetical protein
MDWRNATPLPRAGEDFKVGVRLGALSLSSAVVIDSSGF